MKTVSLPGQLNLHQGGKLFWLSHVTNQDVLCNVIIIKKTPTKRMLNNWKKACRAGLYFFQDLLPLVSKERGKKKTKQNKESERIPGLVPSRPGAWRAARQAGRKSGRTVMETCLGCSGSSPKQMCFCEIFCLRQISIL